MKTRKMLKNPQKNPLILISQYNITEQYKFPLQAPFSQTDNTLTNEEMEEI